MNVYEITVPAERVRLGGDGGGEIVFSVTNRSALVQQVNADVAPSGGTRKEWLTLSGESPRTLSAGGTDQFIVAAGFPPDTPAGTYPFRLRVSSANSRTSEDAAESPIVYFDKSDVVAGGGRRWWIWVAAAVLLLVAGVAGYLLLGNRGPRMPDVVNKDAIEAVRMVQAAKYIVHLAYETDTSTAPGRVIRTKPPAGTPIVENVSVLLIVARNAPGTFDLQGEDARQLSDSTAQQLTQFIAAGNDPPPAPEVTVPAVVGRDAVQAMVQLQAAGLTAKLVTFVSTSHTPNRVVQQDPRSPATLPKGAPVTLFVAQPRVFQPIDVTHVQQLSPALLREAKQFNQHQGKVNQ